MVFRKYMKTIIVAIIAIIALVCGVIITVLLGPGAISGKMIGILTGMIAPTLASLVALLNGEQQKEKLDRVENSTERIDKVVNHEDEVPHQRVGDSTTAKYGKDSR